MGREFENRFIQESEPSRLLKMVGHWELYKKIVHLPGEIFDVGVFKGSSLIQWATYRQALENPEGRKIVGFDTFSAFPVDANASEADRAFVSRFTSEAGVPGEKAALQGHLSAKGFSNVELVGGDIFDTIPEYLANRPECRLALAHVDVDLYGPTQLAIKEVWSRIVRGGVLLFDDYGFVAGASQAVDEFLEREGLDAQRLNTYPAPSFVIKP